ncbi:MAG: DNA repair protein RadA [SAR116 cluster bacterium MED-G04]|jgi:DNA repair protein RadA/Sms|nr:DNA repair protein RadA [SAR116 cluster bacterium]OUW37418.1 MAG: DNA repair protein RadA [Gammaproteobacteria bacterium TMED183]CAI8366077.1 MAG: DNA repair protein RadA [SAR116 cluster bacterium MED-G04]HCV63447.1 DNA repair protein RadA [Alphaproteobacteria bacterium]|tara:strand:+ start:1775 stop:3133 length:1359 start_codon:yes stop_codon:yes gene_type:complete
MAKARATYVCQQCGGVHPKWSGQCDHCGAWNSLTEEVQEKTPGPRNKGREIPMEGLKGSSKPLPRISTGIPEFDRVLGGGLVPGSATLIGGDPGIGKSTLLLQAACRMAGTGAGVAYFSGEESTDQIRMRAERLGLLNNTESVGLAAATDAANIAASLSADPGLRMVIIDSIQTMYLPGVESGPGTVSQVRASTHELIRSTKKLGCALLIVGHVTKEGAIAGPKVLEHMVDTVLQFEGDRSHHFRILRGIKNRFGPTDEIGVFEMTGNGLSEVANPSELFLADRREDVSGAVVFAGIEGTRPLLVEIQALVAPSSMAHPRRNVVGWDSGRLSMLAAVLEARAGLPLSGRDIFLNVAGGVKITEPAADLAVAAALISSVTGRPCPANTVIFGEVGLAAEVRRVAHPEQRLKEAAKLGFEQAILPPAKKAGKNRDSLRHNTVTTLTDLIETLGG